MAWCIHNNQPFTTAQGDGESGELLRNAAHLTVSNADNIIRCLNGLDAFLCLDMNRSDQEQQRER